jgi:ribonuclease HII
MARHRPDFAFEVAARSRGLFPVCGIDEAGRGPWAGPVVAAAVILDPARIPPCLDDSKKLKAGRREALFDLISRHAAVGVGVADVWRIDRDNILAATLWAMGEAVRRLTIAPALALVDGNRAPPLDCPVATVVGGDGRVCSIAAASIVAKVTRDRIMRDLDRDFPDYGFAGHKGYGTALHRAALLRHGPSPAHRLSFAPVRAALAR